MEENNNSQNNSQESKQEEIKITLEEKIAELEQKLSESNDKILRAFAELDNVRRRSREELEKSAKFAISDFASDLVLVMIFCASSRGWGYPTPLHPSHIA